MRALEKTEEVEMWQSGSCVDNMVQVVSTTVHFQEIYLHKIQVFSGGPWC